MTSLIDPSFITAAPVSKTGMRQQLQTAKDEISAIQDTDLPSKLPIAGGTLTGNLILSNAKIGINNATPSWPLVIASQAAAGAIRVLGRAADDIGSIEFMDDTQTTTQSYLQSTPTSMIFGIGATEVMRLTSSGIKTASPLVNVASAATVDLNAQNSSNVCVTGTTTITSLGTAPAGARYYLTFAGALIITYNATSLQTPGLANITTAAGDNAVVRSLGAGNWVIESYTRAAVLPFLNSMATARLLGRTDAGAGPTQEITAGAGLTLSAGALSVSAVVRAWGKFNAGGTLAASFGVSSVTDNAGFGNYTINFSPSLPSADYAIALMSNNVIQSNNQANAQFGIVSQSASSCQIAMGSASADPTTVTFIVVG